ncbi:MAG: hypothetical protein DMD99_01105 [Candidatus Rokuibacteriota bacterium]|nr:MAG: hypothetical protein DMD99_01105 [Candidatus Rokubacteria bacterium]
MRLCAGSSRSSLLGSSAPSGTRTAGSGSTDRSPRGARCRGRWRTGRARPRPSRARPVRHLPRQRAPRGLRSVDPLPAVRVPGGRRLPAGDDRARSLGVRPCGGRRAAHRRALRGPAQLGGRPGDHGAGARGTVSADVLHRDPPDPGRFAEPRPPADLGAGGLAKPGAAGAHARRLRHGLDRPAHPVGRARGAERGLYPDRPRQGRVRGAGGRTLLGGAVVTETVFAWPGIGRLAIQSIYNRDYPIVQCTVFLSAVLFIVINFCIDLIYGLLDPRVRAS